GGGGGVRGGGGGSWGGGRGGPGFLSRAKPAPRGGAARGARGAPPQLPPPLGVGMSWPGKQALADAPLLHELFTTGTGAYGGLFRPGRSVHPHVIVPAILRLYPTGRIVVAEKNRDAQRASPGRLPAAGLPQPVVADRDLLTHWFRVPRVLVTSLAKLDHCTREDFSLAIVPDASPLAGVDQAEPRWTDRGFRSARDYQFLRRVDVPAFGFVPSGLHLTPAHELRL